ncbi:MAG: Ig-like domain-containing protein [Bacteroidota bacterium]
MKITRHLYWLIYLLFFSCAKQSAPTGGPKDTIPPTLVRSIPANQEVNFKGRSVQLTFSEFIQLQNPKEQIIITPAMGKDFEVTARKKTVTIKFERDFDDSTTYTINFRDAVQDLTEKNPARNLKLAISTGSYIDSLSLEGSVYELLTGKEMKDITVAIHEPNDTFNIFKHPAAYFTKTDNKGFFKLQNLKNGVYYIYAIEDKNKNLIADSRNESYGFLTDSINLTENVSGKSIPLIRLDARTLKLTSARPYNTYFNIRTSKSLKFFTARFDNRETISSFAEDQSNVKVFNNIGDLDSLALKFTATDSIGNYLDTTLYVKFPNREVQPDRFESTLQHSSIIANKGLLTAKFKFNKPLKSINFDSLFYRIDSLQRITFNTENIHWDSAQNIMTLEKKVDKTLFLPPVINPVTKDQAKPKAPPVNKRNIPSPKKQANNELVIGQAAFISIELDSSKALRQSIRPSRTDELGVILVDIKTTQKNFIVQLLDKSFTVIQTIKNQTQLKFEDLPPADYQLRLIIDQNQNGLWDPGNFLLNMEPEPIRYYRNEKGTQTFTLKTNWELGPLLITY